MKKGKKFLVSIVIILAPILVVEGYAFVSSLIKGKYSYPERKKIYHPLRHHSWAPQQLLYKGPQNLETDKYGYIITPGSPSQPSIKIVLTGSSGIFSTKPFVSADKTLAAMLQQKINEEANLNVAVRSLAVPGYTAFREFMTAYEYLEYYGFEADLIISVGGTFSVGDFEEKLKLFNANGTIYPIYSEKEQLKVNEIRDGSFKWTLRSFIQAILNIDLVAIKFVKREISLLKSKLRKKFKRSQKDNLETPNEARVDQLYRKLFVRENTIYQMMNLVAKSHDSDFALFLLPTKHSWPHISPNDQKKNIDKQHFFQLLNRFYDDLLKQKPQFPIDDLRNVFNHLPPEKSPYIEKDFTHYNEIGTNALAEAISKSILPKLHELKKNKS